MARFGFSLLIFAVFASLCTAVGRPDDDSCWQMVFDAIRRSAAMPQPLVTSYNERGVVTEDGMVRLRENVFVDYRNDGLAYITDPALSDREATNLLEPGPPLLGPYGAGRSAWLGSVGGEQFPYPLIGSVHNRATEPCVDLGLETYNDAPAYHIVFPQANVNAATLRAIWLSPDTLDVRKTIVGGKLFIVGENKPPVYPNFEVEFQRVGPYNVVRHVTWKYRMRVYSQYTSMFAEYYFGGYAFNNAADFTKATGKR